MGLINLSITGSFDKTESKQFSAMYGGHAMAVAETIEFLSTEVLPAAIKQDHRLHADGDEPIEGFGNKPEI